MPAMRRAAIAAFAVATLATAGMLVWRAAPRIGSPVPERAGAAPDAVPDDDPVAGLPPESSLAPWMRAPATPRVTGQPVVSTRRVEANVSAGGALLQLVADRHRYTLYVPAGAVASDAQVELAQVTQLPGLPFAAQPAHLMRITNLPPSLRTAAVLTIEPASPAGAEPPAMPNAAFAVDVRSRELHAYPFARHAADAATGRAAHMQMRIGRDGLYGVAHADDAELAALDASRPTDLLARVEAMTGQALRDAPPTPPAPTSASAWSGWLPIGSAHAQPAGTGGLDPHVQRVVQALRDYFQQKLLPPLGVIGRGCSGKHRELFATTIHDANRWIHGASLMGLAEADAVAPPDPTVNPYAYHVEAARHAQLEALRDEFQAKAERLQDLIERATRRMYDTVKACCGKSPEAWMPPYLLGMHRQAAFHEAGDALGPGGVGDVSDCACAVAAVHDGVGWTGTIKQTDRFSQKRQTETARSKTESTHDRSYTLDVTLMGAGENGAAIGIATSSGDSATRVHRADTDWACAVDEAGSSREVSGARGVQTGRVSVSVRKDGSYHINFPAPRATGLERHRQYRRREGCKNRFNDDTSDSTSLRAGAVVGLSQRTIRGDTHVPTVLEGSNTESRSDPEGGLERTSTLEWNIRACSAR